MGYTYQSQNVPKDQARFFLSLCGRDNHTFFVAGYTDLRDNSIHYLADLGVGWKAVNKSTPYTGNYRGFLAEIAQKRNELSRNAQLQADWVPAGIRKESYVRPQELLQFEEDTKQKLSTHMAASHKTWHISYEQYLQFAAQIQHIDDTQLTQPIDRYVLQYQKLINEVEAFVQKRAPLIEQLRSCTDTIIKAYVASVDAQQALLEKWKEYFFTDNGAQVLADRAIHLANNEARRQFHLRATTKYFHRAEADKPVPLTSRGQKSEILELSAFYALSTAGKEELKKIENGPDESEHAFAELAEKQRIFLERIANNISEMKSPEMKSVHSQLLALNKKQKELSHNLCKQPYFFKNTDQFEYTPSYCYNTAPDNDPNFNFEYSRTGTYGAPVNKEAAKLAMRKVKLKRKLDASQFDQLHQFKQNCKTFCVDVLNSLEIDDPELGDISVSDLPDTVFISHCEFQTNYLFDRPQAARPEWQTQNPYQSKVLKSLYPRLLKLRKNFDPDEHLLASIKKTLQSRISEQLVIKEHQQQERALLAAAQAAAVEVDFDSDTPPVIPEPQPEPAPLEPAKLSYQDIAELITQPVLAAPLPDSYMQGNLNFAANTLLGMFKVENPFSPYIAAANKEKINTFLKELETQALASAGDLSALNVEAKAELISRKKADAIFDKADLFARLDRLITDKEPEHWHEYLALSRFYEAIRCNLQLDGKKRLSEIWAMMATPKTDAAPGAKTDAQIIQGYSDELEAARWIKTGNTMMEYIDRQITRETEFRDPIKALQTKIDDPAIKQRYPQVCQDAQKVIKHVEELHGTDGCNREQLIKVVKKMDLMIDKLETDRIASTDESKKAVKHLAKVCQRLASSISYSSTGAKVAGALMVFVGSTLVAAGLTSFVVSGGLSTPLSVLLGGAGATLLAAVGTAGAGAVAAATGSAVLLTNSTVKTFFSDHALKRHRLAKHLALAETEVLTIAAPAA